MIPMNAQDFNPPLQENFNHAIREFDLISDERKDSLKQLALYCTESLNKHEEVKLLFVCTHNSRRSHMTQLWAQTAAYFYGLKEIRTYSGGTESAAANPRAMASLERKGFLVRRTSINTEQPVYMVRQGEKFPENIVFSKKYNDPVNPSGKFAAIMVCSDADEACPFVPGAEDRISFPYDDPKVFDDTPKEKSEYDKTSDLIAREMAYVMHLVDKNL